MFRTNKNNDTEAKQKKKKNEKNHGICPNQTNSNASKNEKHCCCVSSFKNSHFLCKYFAFSSSLWLSHTFPHLNNKFYSIDIIISLLIDYIITMMNIENKSHTTDIHQRNKKSYHIYVYIIFDLTMKTLEKPLKCHLYAIPLRANEYSPPCIYIYVCVCFCCRSFDFFSHFLVAIHYWSVWVGSSLVFQHVIKFLLSPGMEHDSPQICAMIHSNSVAAAAPNRISVHHDAMVPPIH